MLASTLQFSNHHTTPPQAPTPQGARPGRRERNTTPDKGPGGPGTQQHAPHHGTPFMLASTLQFSNHHTTPPQAPTPQGARPGRRERNTTPDKGPGGPGTQQHAPHHHQAPEGTRPDSFPASKGRHPARKPGCKASPSSAHDRAPTKLRRQEVIQPHLPVRLPCYDFTTLTLHTFDASAPFGFGRRLRVQSTRVVLRAVCTRTGNVFTAPWLMRDY